MRTITLHIPDEDYAGIVRKLRELGVPLIEEVSAENELPPLSDATKQLLDERIAEAEAPDAVFYTWDETRQHARKMLAEWKARHSKS